MPPSSLSIVATVWLILKYFRLQCDRKRRRNVFLRASYRCQGLLHLRRQQAHRSLSDAAQGHWESGTREYSRKGKWYCTTDFLFDWFGFNSLAYFLFKSGPFPASFCLFSSFQYSWQYTNVPYKSLPMTGFEPRTAGVGSDGSTNCPENNI